MAYSELFATYNMVTPPKGANIEIENTDNIEIFNPLLKDNPFEQISFSKEAFVEEEPTFNNPFPIVNNPTSKPTKSTSTKFSNNKEFISKMRSIYKDVLKSKGLNEKYADYLVAQSALESGYGKHQAGKNNLGGIKGKGSVKSTKEFINGKYVTIKDSFRDFNSLRDYAEYHVNLLNNNRYKAFNGDFISSVVRGGYATDPSYRSKLQKIYESVIKS